MSCSGFEAQDGNSPDTGVIFNIQRFSIEDGPGIRTTVFMKGCPMRCVWCHNPEGISFERQLMWFDVRCIQARDCIEACPQGALELGRSGMAIDRDRCDACGRCADACPARAIEVVGTAYTPDEAFGEVYRDEAFYRNSGGGVTISGGEPGMQPRFVEELLGLCGEAGLRTAIDTCAYAGPEVLERLADLADMVLLDLKIMDAEKHLELTGVELAPVLENARMLARKGKPVWVRTPVVPDYTDSDENIASIGRFIVAELPGVERWDLLAFNNTCGSKYSRLDMKWPLEGAPLLSADKMEALAERARASGVPEVCWSGATCS